MREIEFRVYVKDKNKIFNVKTIDFSYKFITFEEKNKLTDTVRMFDQVELMQYTGLTDKNGTKIFEGDIIIFNKGRNLPNYVSIPEVVRYHQGDLAFQRYPYNKHLTTGGAGKLIQPDMMDECEVIGNIYDNPELLEVEK